MRLGDIQLAFPFILLAIAVIGVLGPSLPVIIVVIGVSSWVIYASSAPRCCRSANGSSCRPRAPWADGLADPGPSHPAQRVHAVAGGGDAGHGPGHRHRVGAVLPGLGVQPPTPTWGGMLADGRVYITTVARHLSRPGHPAHRAGDQPLRRRPARYAGPPAQGVAGAWAGRARSSAPPPEGEGHHGGRGADPQNSRWHVGVEVDGQNQRAAGEGHPQKRSWPRPRCASP